jgi:hypothetical protein
LRLAGFDRVRGEGRLDRTAGVPEGSHQPVAEALHDLTPLGQDRRLGRLAEFAQQL